MPTPVSFQASRDRVTIMVTLVILSVVIVVGAIPVYVAITDPSCVL